MKRVLCSTMKNLTYDRYDKLQKGIIDLIIDKYDGEVWEDWGDGTTCVRLDGRVGLNKIRQDVKDFAAQKGYDACFITSAGYEAKSITRNIAVQIFGHKPLDPYVDIYIDKDYENSESGKTFVDITCQYVG